jgi:hypothetical protein
MCVVKVWMMSFLIKQRCVNAVVLQYTQQAGSGVAVTFALAGFCAGAASWSQCVCRSHPTFHRFN